MSTIPALDRVVQFTRKDVKETETIQCPCCGTNTYIPYVYGSTNPNEEQRALRERMRRAGLTLKAVRFWTTKEWKAER